ncbi:hypothetical protein HHI36_003465 [Cryptolaemus montrouzieri]|uniref:Solute carrier family 46 member 3 n=1 Tax=Cryptolaemus montrouzieri TaxID=559131 RepID=A0ABD2PDX6_9CUCU
MSRNSFAKPVNGDPQSTTEGITSFREKFKFVITHITVEPIVFSFIMISMMNNIVNQNLLLEKVCRVNLHWNESICDALVSRNKSGYLPHHEMEVQQFVVKWSAYRTVITGMFQVIGIIFLGSWSDRHRRRKPIILMPVIGELIASIGLFLCSYFFLELPMEYAWMVDTFCAALFGGQCTLFLGVFSYVAGISTEKDKTLRIGSVAISYSLALTSGMFIGGILLNRLGFLGCYSISISIATSAIVYGFIIIKEKTVKEKEEKKIGFLKDLFALEHIKNTFRTCFQKREDNRRTKIIVLIFLCSMLVGPVQGELNLTYMFLRLKFGWNEVDFSIYNALHSSVQTLGSVFALTVLSKYLKLDDAVLGIIAVVSKVSGCAIYAFAPSGMFFYIGAIAELFFPTCFIAMRALMAKIVPTYELGQSNSVFGICEALMPFFFGPIYSKIYIETIHVYAGTFFLFSVLLYTAALFSYIYLYRNRGRQANGEFQEQEQTDFKKSRTNIANEMNECEKRV